jgi:hypothetical protein
MAMMASLLEGEARARRLDLENMRTVVADAWQWRQQ